MKFRAFHYLLVALGFAWFGVLASCGKEGAAQKAPEEAAEEKQLERISVSEIGKIRSRVGSEVVVYGKVSQTSTSSSGHQFLNFPNGFKIVCLKGDVAGFGGGGPAELYRGKLVEVRGEIASHQGKPQIAITTPDQIKTIELGKGGARASGKSAPAKFELIEIGQNAWVSPAGLRYVGRDAQGLSRKDHILRHAKDQPGRAGSHGVFDAEGDGVFQVIDEAWAKIKQKRLRPRTEGDSQTYLVPMGRKIGYLGGKNGARRKHPALSSVFIVVRKGTTEVVTAFPR
ncbi:MAG: hypothetical protein ACR2RV_24135 [Verrucomicrobiales bacterium]